MDASSEVELVVFDDVGIDAGALQFLDIEQRDRLAGFRIGRDTALEFKAGLGAAAADPVDFFRALCVRVHAEVFDRVKDRVRDLLAVVPAEPQHATATYQSLIQTAASGRFQFAHAHEIIQRIRLQLVARACPLVLRALCNDAGVRVLWVQMAAEQFDIFRHAIDAGAEIILLESPPVVHFLGVAVVLVAEAANLLEALHEHFAVALVGRVQQLLELSCALLGVCLRHGWRGGVRHWFCPSWPLRTWPIPRWRLTCCPAHGGAGGRRRRQP